MSNQTIVIDGPTSLLSGENEIMYSHEISEEPIEVLENYAVYKSSGGYVYTFRGVSILFSVCYHKKLLQALELECSDKVQKEYYFLYHLAMRNKKSYEQIIYRNSLVEEK